MVTINLTKEQFEALCSEIVHHSDICPRDLKLNDSHSDECNGGCMDCFKYAIQNASGE